jgi:tetratricopeptide (TPR) repeat protein
MKITNMAEELFVRAPAEFTLISDADAEVMKKAVLSARDIGAVMMMLNEGMTSRFKRAARYDELLQILGELHGLPFMQPAAVELYLKEGSVCESMLEYARAIEYYNKGIMAYAAMVKPKDKCGYWLFNNNSFCHDYEKLFPEAQRLAEKAISIDNKRHNAWKNRGISLEHQGDYVEAAASYLVSFIQCGGGEDPRPMMHLKRIFRRHDGLRDDLAAKARKIMGKIFSGSYRIFCLAETYYHCGHLDRALREYKRFHSMAPYGYAGHLKYVQKVIKDLKELKRIEAQLA